MRKCGSLVRVGGIGILCGGRDERDVLGVVIEEKWLGRNLENMPHLIVIGEGNRC